MITCERCTKHPAAVVRAYPFSGCWRVCHPCAIRLDQYHATVPANPPLVNNPAVPTRSGRGVQARGEAA